MASDRSKLTKPQAEALRKWVEYGKPAHQKLLGINKAVFNRLWIKGMLSTTGFIERFPNEKGLAALAAYDAERARKTSHSKESE